jgi:hypothetical protein
MSRRRSTSDGSITGVATGNLGTGTALDDTQVYSVDALTTADHPDDVADAVGVQPHAEPAHNAPKAQPVATTPPARPEPAGVAVPRAPARRLPGQRRITGGYPVGILTAGVVALIAVAAVLTLRDGGLVGGGGTGSGLAGAASFPPVPSFGALETAAPRPTSGTQGKGNSHGHGHGR